MEEIGIDLKLEVSAEHPVPPSGNGFCLPTGRADGQDPTLAAQLADKQALISSLPASDDELYTAWRKLEAHRDFLQLQEVSASVPVTNIRTTFVMRRGICDRSCCVLRRK